ncbi:FtsX-like permease family protein, partial [Candidatus Dojkabacteria bacterium]|nr:FtsX-like permease family protein [Candidatus Dojkabacteria bacterium]
EGTVAFYDLVDLSVRNMFSKKARTWITIGGVSIGIAFIVFLVSVGYGLESLVISRVARLEELKQLEATPAVSSNIYITDETINDMQAIQGVKQVLPIINVAARVSYQNSNTDAVAFGAQSAYLTETAIKPRYGEIFDSNLLNNPVTPEPEPDSTGRDVSDVSVSLVDELTTEISRQAADETTASGDIVKVALPDKARVADVNEAFLHVIGLDPAQAVGKKIMVTFVVTGQLAPGQQKTETLPVEYDIIGVIPEGDTSLVYVPIVDLKEIGIERYSLIKIVAENEDVLLDVRRNVEASGFRTSAVIDTVVQIEQLFVTVRLAFGIVGIIALSVAALGMFNTLTVSLLERTREVGLLKAIGMKPDEVEDLFIAESVSMGFLGGLLGLAIGLGVGKMISLLLSVYAISKGYEGIDVTYLPTVFVFLVVILSAFVGMLTGYLPAKRSTHISAINALRYE